MSSVPFSALAALLSRAPRHRTSRVRPGSPNGTLNMPDLFVRYMPAKAVRFRYKNLVARSNADLGHEARIDPYVRALTGSARSALSRTNGHRLTCRYVLIRSSLRSDSVLLAGRSAK